MAEPTKRSRIASALHILAATLGTLPAALLATVALARFLPLRDDVRVAIGFAAMIPLWIAAIALGLLARSALRAWAACLGAAIVLGVMVYGVPG
jgi:hypothetical protein